MINLDNETIEQLEKAMKEFKGNGLALESALGAVLIGQIYGWRALKMMHNPTTYAKYEKILGIKYRDICKEETKYTHRNTGMKVAKKLRIFWEIVKGTHKVDKKGHYE